MNTQELKEKLESQVCKTHDKHATILMVNDNAELSDVCCEDFKNILMGIIDDDLHQRYTDDLDNLFS